MAWLIHSIVSRFELAGLRVSVASQPLARTSNTAIVQLDIARGRTRRDEHFRLWPGAGTNRIEVQGVDRDQQLLGDGRLHRRSATSLSVLR